MYALLQVISYPGRPEESHVRPHWVLALQVRDLRERLQQTNQPEEPHDSTPTLCWGGEGQEAQREGPEPLSSPHRLSDRAEQAKQQ